MQHFIYSYREVKGVPATLERTLLDRTTELLRTATVASEGAPDRDGSFLVELEGDVAGLRLAKRVRLSVGEAQRDRNRVKLPISWHADPGRQIFPRFTGALEWEPLDADLGQLTLSGTYDTPLGLLGGAADATVLRDIAHGTADWLLTAVAHELPALALQSAGLPLPTPI